MKKLKTFAAVLCILTLAAATATAESKLNEEFGSFGIKSIGIYTESYEDERVEDFESEYLDAYMMQYVNTFRYTLCDYNAVTPKLMTPNYPLEGAKNATELDVMVSNGVSFMTEEEGWKTSIIDNFEGGSLAELREQAAADGRDAVLVVRYYSINYYVPFSGYSSVSSGGYSYTTTTTTAKVGKLMKGLGLLPALELYDVKSGVRLWFSANWTGTINNAAEGYDMHNKNAGDLFVDETAVADGSTLETEAVANMVAMAITSHDFPAASASGSRNEAVVAAQSSSSHMFWTDYPEYEKFGTFIGLGYNIGYVGDYDIYYHDENLNDYDEEGNPIPDEHVGTAEKNIMHTLTIPIFAFGTKNIAIEPSFYFGFMQPKTASITYTYLQETEETEVTETGEASVWGLTVGLDAAVKYYLRFSDTVSAFIGGRGLIEMWLINVNPENEEINSYNFGDSVGGLAQLDYFTLNASILAGVRLDTKTPIEFYGMFTPVGPGGDPMITAGMTWHGIPIGVTPHSKNTDPIMAW